MRGVLLAEGRCSAPPDLPEPAPIHGEVVVHVQLAGICDTDLQLIKGYMGFRGIPGHEFVGRLDDGTRVTAEINNACGVCPTCAAGLRNHCPSRIVTGILNHDGAMAERVAVPRVNVHTIPDALPDRQAVFIEPLAAALRILDQVDSKELQSVAVLGDGKLGLLCARVLHAAGAEVLWVGKHPEKLAHAGAGIETSVRGEVSRRGSRFGLVVDATASDTGLSDALSLVKPTGVIVLKTTIAHSHALSLSPVVIDEVRVVGSRCGPFPKAIEWLTTKRVLVDDLIEAEYPLEHAVEAFAHAQRPAARKILLRIGN